MFFNHRTVINTVEYLLNELRLVVIPSRAVRFWRFGIFLVLSLTFQGIGEISAFSMLRVKADAFRPTEKPPEVGILDRSNQIVDLVIDFDGTLVQAYKPGSMAYSMEGGTVISELKHFLAPGAIEFLQALSQIPNFRLHYFSAGNEGRNLELKALLAELVRSRFGTSLGGDVYSWDSLTFKEDFDGMSDLDIPSELLTQQEGYTPHLKNLRSIREVDLSFTILVDDTPDVIYPGQTNNVILLDKGLGELFSTILPPSKWSLQRVRVAHNLVRALGLILQAREDFLSSKEASVVDALRAIYVREESYSQMIYEKGFLAMKTINPDLRLPGMMGTPGVEVPWQKR